MIYFHAFIQWFWTVTLTSWILGAFYVCYRGWREERE